MLNPGDPAFMPHARIATKVLQLFGADRNIELWAFYGAYDHVALAQLWGPMVDLPPSVPMWTHDLMQERERHGNPVLSTANAGDPHNALNDARLVKRCYEQLNAASSVGPQL